MPPRGFMGDCSIVFGSIGCVEQLATVLNEVAKYVALNLILNALAKGRIGRVNIGKGWYLLCQDMLKV